MTPENECSLYLAKKTSSVSLTYPNCIRFAKRLVAGYSALFLTRSDLMNADM